MAVSAAVWARERTGLTRAIAALSFRALSHVRAKVDGHLVFLALSLDSCFPVPLPCAHCNLDLTKQHRLGMDVLALRVSDLIACSPRHPHALYSCPCGCACAHSERASPVVAQQGQLTDEVFMRL